MAISSMMASLLSQQMEVYQHMGICNMMENAKEITGLNKFSAVLGGFHLKFDNHQTKEGREAGIVLRQRKENFCFL